MAVVAVDLDNTLYSFDIPAREAFLQLALERDEKGYFRGAYNAWGEWRSMTDACGDDIQEEVIQMVHEETSILRQHPFKGAADVLTDLSKEHEILYISNRDPDKHDATEQWLDENGFPLSRNLLCTRDSKIPLVYHCQYLIDDRPRTLVQFVYDFQWKYKWGSENPERARKAFSLAYPYNQALTDVPGMYLAPTWLGIRHYLQEKGVINGSANDRHGDDPGGSQLSFLSEPNA